MNFKFWKLDQEIYFQKNYIVCVTLITSHRSAKFWEYNQNQKYVALTICLFN